MFQYADFGVPGVLVLGFLNPVAVLNAILLYLLFRNPGLSLSRPTLGQFLVLLAQFGPLFGLYFPGLLYWMLFAVIALLLRMVRPPMRRRAVAAAAR